MPAALSLPEARRLAVAAQGFGARPASPSLPHLRKLAARIHAFQIDSVNVLVRAHYVPAFARLGPYSMEALDTLAYRKRQLFEYWGHEACLLPISLYPLLRYRMQRQADATREYMGSAAGAYMARVYEEVGARGPLTAGDLSDPGVRSKGWWSWWGTGNGKASLEHLYDAGFVAIAGRRGFERLYDLAERVIPQEARNAPAIPAETAMKQLICLAAAAHGVGTTADLAGYFDVGGRRDRVPPGPRWAREGAAGERTASLIRRLFVELVEEKRLVPVSVDGWPQQAYLSPQARVPRSIDARGIVTPFDSLVWQRTRLHRLFGMKYSIEIYLPPEQRIYGYYVCPFLLGDMLVARCDLKSDRTRGLLLVRGAFLERGQDPSQVATELAGELRQLQAWLGLEGMEIGRRGDLAARLRQILKPGSLRARRSR